MKRKLVILWLCLFILIATCTAVIVPLYTTALAESTYQGAELLMGNSSRSEKDNLKIINPFTSLSISLNGRNGKIWATAKNDFTLFPATVIVVIHLYSSNTYNENYQNMTLVATKSTTDLNIGKTLTVEAPTNGEQKYWIARMRYQIDGGDWGEKILGPALYSVDGIFMGLI